MHLHAGGGKPGLQLHQQVRQVGQRVLAHRLAQVAQAFQLIRVGELRQALALQEVHRAAETLAQLGIVQRFAGACLEVLRRNKIQCVLAHCPASAVSVSITTHSRRGPCAP
ncbi:hypothetical protein D3C72_1719190 [compost metagenome]